MQLKSLEVTNQLREQITLTLHPNQSKIPKKVSENRMTIDPIIKQIGTRNLKKSETNTKGKNFQR